MKAVLPALASILVLAACVPATNAPPAAAPAPVARRAPAPAPAPAPQMQASVSDSWMDAPATPGSWGYQDRGDHTLAAFTTPSRGNVFAIHCNRPSRNIALLMAGQASTNPAMIIRTETTSRAIGAAMLIDEFAHVTAALTANDPLLDAMALSKGRFAVEAEGLQTLYLPAWAEVSRVIEDCR